MYSCRLCREPTRRTSRVCLPCQTKRRRQWMGEGRRDWDTLDLVALNRLIPEQHRDFVTRWWSQHHIELDDVIIARDALRQRCAKYKLTLGHWLLLVAQNDGRCAICRKPSNPLALNIDHDHASGRVRGLLCTPCNTGLGALGIDGPEAMARAEAVLGYVRKSTTSISGVPGRTLGDRTRPSPKLLDSAQVRAVRPER